MFSACSHLITRRGSFEMILNKDVNIINVHKHSNMDCCSSRYNQAKNNNKNIEYYYCLSYEYGGYYYETMVNEKEYTVLKETNKLKR